MKRELLSALRGARYPLGQHHRVAMVLVAFMLMYLLLWVLHLTYAGKDYVLLALLVLPALVVGARAARFLRIAVLSPSKSTAKDTEVAT
jgi:hypothetical protein